MVTPRPDKPDKIVPDGARPKNGWFYLASWTRRLQETSRKLTSLCQTAPEFPFVFEKDRIWCCLAQSGHLPSSFQQTSGAGSQIEPAIFWSCSVWHDFVWSWCNHTINGILKSFKQAGIRFSSSDKRGLRLKWDDLKSK